MELVCRVCVYKYTYRVISHEKSDKKIIVLPFLRLKLSFAPSTYFRRQNEFKEYWKGIKHWKGVNIDQERIRSDGK